MYIAVDSCMVRMTYIEPTLQLELRQLSKVRLSTTNGSVYKWRVKANRDQLRAYFCSSCLYM